MIALPQLTQAEIDLASRCIRAGIFEQKPGHVLARFLIAQRSALHEAAIARAVRAHEAFAEREAQAAAALLADWRASEHHCRFLSQAPDTIS